MEIFCSRCGETKDENEFYASKRHKNGRKTPCIECKKEYNREYMANTYQKGERRRPVEAPTGKFKSCTKCKEKKDLADFHVGDRAGDRKSACKVCINKQARKRVLGRVPKRKTA